MNKPCANRNYARLLLKGSSRQFINTALKRIGEIQSEAHEQDLRKILNDEKALLNADKPKSKVLPVAEPDADARDKAIAARRKEMDLIQNELFTSKAD